MRYRQVLVYENGNLLGSMLEERAEKERWLLRHPREPSDIDSLLERGGSAVFVLRVQRHLEFEIGLLVHIRRRHPDVPVVVIGEEAQAPLVGLAWDLGAAYVLILPQSKELLPDIVSGLLGS